MDELLTDQQQADKVKGWATRYGPTLIGGIVLGTAAIFGSIEWRAWQEQRKEHASDRYEVFMEDARANQIEAAEAQLAILNNDFGSSPYVDQARLVMAKLYLDRSLPEKAAEQLQAVVDKAATPEIRNIARLRLARALIYQEQYEAALKALPDPGARSFRPAFHEVRGDAYAALGRVVEARNEYQQALTAGVGAAVIDASYVQAKLDALGGTEGAPQS